MRERWGDKFRFSVLWVSWCCLLFIALSVTPRSALAEDLVRAQAAYNEGFDLYQKRKYRKALRFFDQAIKMAPTTRRYARFRGFLQFLSGMSQYRLRRWQLARRHLSTFLQAGEGRKEHRQQATLALRESKQRLRQLAALRRARLRKRTRPQALPPARRPIITPSQPVAPPPTPTPKEGLPTESRPTPLRTAPPIRLAPARPVPRRFVSPSPRRAAASPVARGTRSALLTTSSAPSSQRTVPPTSSYALAAVGGAVFVVGGVLLGVALATQAPALALHDEHKTSSAPKPFANEVREPLASARTMTYIAYPMLGTGVALAATGLILFFVARRPAPSSPPGATKAPTQLFLHRLFP